MMSDLSFVNFFFSSQVFDIVWRCLVHSQEAARLVCDCPLLLQLLFTTFIAFSPHAPRTEDYPYA